jgi:hypothetical protein
MFVDFRSLRLARPPWREARERRSSTGSIALATLKNSRIACAGDANTRTSTKKIRICHGSNSRWKTRLPMNSITATASAASGPWTSVTRMNARNGRFSAAIVASVATCGSGCRPSFSSFSAARIGRNELLIR